MRAAAFILSILFLLPGSLSAQGMMRMYRMMYSVSGSFSSGQNDTDIKGVGAPSRITSYNVCYTKLLRGRPHAVPGSG